MSTTGAADPLGQYAAAQARFDPVAQYAEHRQHELEDSDAAREAAERELSRDSEVARWWEDLHVVERDRVAALRHGPTAYRLIGDSGPVVVLLHGAFSCSYVWLDLVKRFASAGAGGLDRATRVLLFDFYGRGRSPWPRSNPKCTVELLALQLQELLEVLGLADAPLVLVGYDMGCVVGAAFAAQHRRAVRGLIALGPAGTARPPLHVERLLESSALWGVDDEQLGTQLERLHQDDFFDQRLEAGHHSLMRLHVAMIGWQIANTPGYLEAVKSTCANFPLSTPVGKNTKGVLESFLDPLLNREGAPAGLSVYKRLEPEPNKLVVLWGAQDALHVPALGAQALAHAVPGVSISYVLNCGHAVHLEGYRQAASLVREHIINFLPAFERPTGPEHPTEPVMESEMVAAQPKPTVQDNWAALQEERCKVAKQLVECLDGPHKFDDVLRVFNKAKEVKLEGMLFDEVARIILFQSRARLFQHAVQMCMQFDDMESLARAIYNARVWFLKSVKAYAPCHCSHCSQWASKLDSLDSYVSERLKTHALAQVQDALQHARTPTKSDSGLPSPARSPPTVTTPHSPSTAHWNFELDASSYEKSHSRARRAAGHIATGKARMPGVDFEGEAADAVFDLLDVESSGLVRPHELFALTSLIDSPTDEIRRIHERVLEGQGGDGMVQRKTFRLLYPSLLKPLVVKHASTFELALSACLKVAHHHYQLDSRR